MTKKLNQLSIGEILSKQRQKNKISIKAISNTLKVKESDIIDLENNNLYQTKSIAYISGLIRSYGSLLKIDTDILNNQVKQLLDKQFQKQPQQNIKKNKFNYIASNKLITYSIVILIFLYSIISYNSKSVDLELPKLLQQLH